MGIKHLNKFLDNQGLIKEYKNIYSYFKKNNFINNIIAIDVMLYIYKFKYSYNDIIYGFTKQIIHFLNNRIIPVYVFDGIPLSEKECILKSRRNKKNNITKKIKNLNNYLNKNFENNKLENDKINDKIKKLQKNKINIHNCDIKKLIKLFKIFNIKHIQSFNEADISIANLYKKKKISCCLSEDTDIIVFGCNNMIKLYNHKIYEYNLKYILDKLDLDKDKFIDMCILFGCDYIKSISRDKPIEIYRKIKNYPSINDIINEINTKINKKDYLLKYEEIKKIYKYKTNESFNYNCKFSIIKKINIDKLKNFLRKNLNSKKDDFIEKYVYFNISNINNMIKNKLIR